MDNEKMNKEVNKATAFLTGLLVGCCFWVGFGIAMIIMLP